MPHMIDLGGAPACEDCAQLGHTPDFGAINQLEVLAYRLAIIARLGLPPTGCRLAGFANHHDFGTYRTLVLHIDDDVDPDVRRYAEAVENGIATWSEAGFAPPVIYDDGTPIVPRRDPAEIIIGALQTTRPAPDGSFPVADFETLHTNLCAAFPEQAEIARARLEPA